MTVSEVIDLTYGMCRLYIPVTYITPCGAVEDYGQSHYELKRDIVRHYGDCPVSCISAGILDAALDEGCISEDDAVLEIYVEENRENI